MREHDASRQKFIRKLKTIQKRPDNYDTVKLLQLENSLKEENKNIEVLKAEDWARKAGFHELYLGAYSVLSNTIHVKIGDLEQYVIVNDADNIINFKHGPDDTGLNTVLSSAIENVLFAGRIILEFFKIDKIKPFDDLFSELQALPQ